MSGPYFLLFSTNARKYGPEKPRSPTFLAYLESLYFYKEEADLKNHKKHIAQNDLYLCNPGHNILAICCSSVEADSPQVIQDLISSIMNFVHELPHDLSNDLRLRS